MLKNKVVIGYMILGIVSLMVLLSLPPMIFGDGREYMAMTISFAEHLWPNLTQNVLDIRQTAEAEFDIYFPIEGNYNGYYEALNGDFYSYHFWFYSLISVIPYLILKALGISILKTFIFTNGIIYIFLLLKIYYTKGLSKYNKIWLTLFSLFSPIILYLPWGHTEVFSYVFLLIGLLYAIEKKVYKSIIFISLASLQNPAISFITLFILLYEAYLVKKDLLKFRIPKKIWIIIGLMTINLVPYIFYYLYYGQFSLIASTGYSSIDLISIKKISSLFFDLNFGLIIYVPLLILTIIYLAFKRNRFTVYIIFILLFISMICATQLNWNSGMMYINRYSVWLIPLLLLPSLMLVDRLKLKRFVVYLTTFILTSGVVTTICLYQYDGANYLKFSPVAKFVIQNTPKLYNPEYEVFIERSENSETGLSLDELPVRLVNENGIIVKELVHNGQQFTYINHNKTLDNINIFSDITRIKFVQGSQDILNDDIEAGLFGDWYDIEGDEMKYRWFKNSAGLVISYEKEGNALVTFDIASFHRDREVQIIVNGTEIFNGEVSDYGNQFEMNLVLQKGDNIIKFNSLTGYDIPKNMDPTFSDTRALSFFIANFEIN